MGPICLAPKIDRTGGLKPAGYDLQYSAPLIFIGWGAAGPKFNSCRKM